MSKPQKAKVTKRSTCNCGKVAVEVTGNDKGTVLCHCDNCKKTTGSAFCHNYRFTSAELKVLKGEDLLKAYKDGNTKSGNVLSRNFCSNCGSPVFLTNSAIKNFYILYSGCLDGERPQPSMELFPEEKYSWVGDVVSKSKL